MLVEETIESMLPATDVIAALMKQMDLGNHVLYEHGDTVYFAGLPVWEITLTAVDENPWDRIATATATNGYSECPIYGWIAFELASANSATVQSRVRQRIQQQVGASTLAHLFVPGLEISCRAETITIRSQDQQLLMQVRDIIQVATPYEPALAQGIDVAQLDAVYLESVATAVAQIKSGALQKVILSRVVQIPFAVNMLDTYIRGRAANTPARSFLMKLGSWEVAGFSPETVVEVGSDGMISTQPLAGTRALTGDTAVDARLRWELVRDPKEIFEHAASVKLACDELETVADHEGQHVSEFMVVKPRGSVQHLGSRVSCRLAAGKTRWDALQALFPAITASGIPKEPAYRVICEQEPTPRMLYSGAVLRGGDDGSLDAALVLRSVYSRNGQAWLRAGAGIVQDSRPEREHEETCEKLSSVAPYLVPMEKQL